MSIRVATVPRMPIKLKCFPYPMEAGSFFTLGGYFFKIISSKIVSISRLAVRWVKRIIKIFLEKNNTKIIMLTTEIFRKFLYCVRILNFLFPFKYCIQTFKVFMKGIKAAIIKKEMPRVLFWL